MRNLAAALNEKLIVKAADQSITNSALLANDNDFLFPVTAGEAYWYDLMLVVAAGSSTIDFKCGMIHPGGSNLFCGTGLDPAVGAGTIGSFIASAYAAAASGSFLSFGVASAATGVRVWGCYRCTTTGTMRFAWCQNTATASPLTLYGGSVMRVREV